jgi:hypothetical protein
MYGGTANRMLSEEILKCVLSKVGNILRCGELRLEGTRFSITYRDSEICIMMTSGCKRGEYWQKIGLLAYNCEGKKESVIKEQDN